MTVRPNYTTPIFYCDHPLDGYGPTCTREHRFRGHERFPTHHDVASEAIAAGWHISTHKETRPNGVDLCPTHNPNRGQP